MAVKIPISKKAGDILKLLQKLPGWPIPQGVVDVEEIRKMGFSASSAANLVEIFKMIAFIGEDQRATPVWTDYVSSDDRARILGSAIQTAYAGLFHEMMCPYLGGDKDILDYFKQNVEASPRELENGLETFRALCEMADFQDSLNDFDCVEPALTPKMPELPAVQQLKVDPNLQMNIQIHIDPNTPDEKIEAIFRYMRKYLLGKE